MGLCRSADSSGEVSKNAKLEPHENHKQSSRNVQLACELDEPVRLAVWHCALGLVLDSIGGESFASEIINNRPK